MEASAVIDGQHRYLLTRSWGPGKRIGWCMLNPSTADAKVDDPTIRRCISFAKSWGFDGIEVVNLFSWRATDPKKVREFMTDAVGHLNGIHVQGVVERCQTIVAAWGATPWAEPRSVEMLWSLRYWGADVVCVGVTKSGAPRHPLYVKAVMKPTNWPADTAKEEK